MKAMHIRQPAVSGLFYPADPTLLSLHIDSLLDEHSQAHAGALPLGVIAPHAGYAWSGSVAAAAYARLRGHNFRTAVIVSPSHREYFNGISVFEGDAYRTPLGLINVDVELREKLLASRGVIHESSLGHRDEHAIEVHLPFLQRVNPDAKILPIVMGDQRAEHCSLLADALAASVNPANTIIIASSDLSHFHDQLTAVGLDNVAAKDIREGLPMKLLDDLATHRCEACGGGPIAVVLSACAQLGADNVSVLKQCTSGDVSGDTQRVVGYLSAIVSAAMPGKRP
ncbi:MAG: AmmeMemoRadiSam system protein B [Bacteroidia bacterium]|nr:AmmeMemoRadiSam system protein B [Bacteroidia bacterium]